MVCSTPFGLPVEPERALHQCYGTGVSSPLPMDIRFISSLTPEDESRVAPNLIELIGGFLDALSVAYTLRIETQEGDVVGTPAWI